MGGEPTTGAGKQSGQANGKSRFVGMATLFLVLDSVYHHGMGAADWPQHHIGNYSGLHFI